MKALIISNPFKGTLSSKEIGEIIKEELKTKGIEANYIPSTDGGDGFFDAFSYIYKDSLIRKVEVRMPNGIDRHIVNYLFNPLNKTSYISLSDTCGIKYLSKLDPFNSNTYGFGETVKYSILNDKPKTIYLGLGGSASVDMGCGMLEALGVKFYDKFDKLIESLSNSKLKEIESIDTSELDKLTKGIEFKALVDVNATIFDNGATDLYALSKGANKEDLPLIKSNVENYFKCVKNIYKNVIDKNGFGVAGGTSFSLYYFMNSKLISGSDEFLKLIDFDRLNKEYDVIITGEGTIDNQTFQGKLIKSIMDHKPNRLIILCAINNSIYKDNVYSIVPDIMSKEESINKPKEALIKLVNSIDFNK